MCPAWPVSENDIGAYVRRPSPPIARRLDAMLALEGPRLVFWVCAHMDRRGLERLGYAGFVVSKLRNNKTC